MAIINEKGQIITKMAMLTGTTRNGETWKKQTIILEVIDGNYMHHLALDAMNEKVDQLAAFQEGDKVDVGYVVGSREYNGRWYTDVKLVGIRFDKPEAQAPKPAQPQQARPAARQAAPQPAAAPAAEGEDDLPF